MCLGVCSFLCSVSSMPCDPGPIEYQPTHALKWSWNTLYPWRHQFFDVTIRYTGTNPAISVNATISSNRHWIHMPRGFDTLSKKYNRNIKIGLLLATLSLAAAIGLSFVSSTAAIVFGILTAVFFEAACCIVPTERRYMQEKIIEAQTQYLEEQVRQADAWVSDRIRQTTGLFAQRQMPQQPLPPTYQDPNFRQQPPSSQLFKGEGVGGGDRGFNQPLLASEVERGLSEMIRQSQMGGGGV